MLRNAGELSYAGPRQPEKDLALAILEDAVSCLASRTDDMSNRAKALVTDSLEWVTARDVRDHTGKPHIFSFESVCEQLDFDAEYLRAGILKRYNEDL